MMLRKKTGSKTPTVAHLTAAWAQLYTPSLRSYSLSEQPFFYSELIEITSPAGRAVTAAKLAKPLLKSRCEVASIQTSSLYTSMQSSMDLREVKRLAEVSFEVYRVLIVLYQHNALETTLPLCQALPHTNTTGEISLVWGTPNIESLATALAPCLLEYQQAHEQLFDCRAGGFLTTQFNFCNQWLMDLLTPIELVLLRPYLLFVEEQVAHPWQRVCAAASRYSIDSPVIHLVEKMIPLSQEIAQAAYDLLVKQLPRHCSRRGFLDQSDITHSCVRDLKIFQAYLWLCVLEESLLPVEQELLNLCIRVLPSLGVKWELVELWMQVLADELLRHLSPQQQQHVQPYASEMHQLLLTARKQLDTPWV